MASRQASVDVNEIRTYDEAQLLNWLEERDIPREFCGEFESKLPTCQALADFRERLYVLSLAL